MSEQRTYTFLSIILLATVLFNCQNKANETFDEPTNTENPKEWSKNATIYEVNIRQYTPEGTINAFAEHIPELDSLGVDILWLMPIYPIGEKNRKGSLGSAYSVKDYRAVNPDFGTLEDLQNLVNKAHKAGMHVILDWVANHTSWDNPLAELHPDWYKKDSLGNFTPPVPDWADVIHLDYSNPELRKYMIESLKFWIKEAGIDGYRCDVAMMVPTDFWEQARTSLDSLKPVFMLAEADQPDLVKKAFDMHYGWELHHIMNQIAQGKMTPHELDVYFTKYDSLYEPDDIRMNFTSNHDENSWNGTVKERMGEAAPLMTVFSYVVPGMPLIYSGQEAGLNKRLAFFDKDSINWKSSKWRLFYKRLNLLRKNNPALFSSTFGGKLVKIKTTNPAVYAFERSIKNNSVLAFFNMSATQQQAAIVSEPGNNSYTDYFEEAQVNLAQGDSITLGPWNFLILTHAN